MTTLDIGDNSIKSINIQKIYPNLKYIYALGNNNLSNMQINQIYVPKLKYIWCTIIEKCINTTAQTIKQLKMKSGLCIYLQPVKEIKQDQCPNSSHTRLQYHQENCSKKVTKGDSLFCSRDSLSQFPSFCIYGRLLNNLKCFCKENFYGKHCEFFHKNKLFVVIENNKTKYYTFVFVSIVFVIVVVIIVRHCSNMLIY